ncbi:hypothetical protein N8Z86_03105 [Amylibacter sp.]|nr:hypothetical protein [Amylibacter sp.]MDC1243097.1 hypothetical protein [Amylibacter sp.]
MLIGLDFDNTIVSYDALFHKVAVEQALIPADLPKSKIMVRDYLRKVDNETAWIEMQGYVYGARMRDATAYPGVIEFIKHARDKGISMAIVSHKTKHPFLGPKYDLHDAARGWIANVLRDGVVNLIEPDHIFFELTKEEKIARVADIRCDYFIDDLPEILLMPGFPKKTKRILFDPEAIHNTDGICANLGSWQKISTFFETTW